MTNEDASARFVEVEQRKRAISLAMAVLRTEREALDAELVAMSGIAKGDRIERAPGQWVQVNTIEPDTFCLEGGVEVLVVGGMCSPITEIGTASLRHKGLRWNKTVREVMGVVASGLIQF